MRIWDKATLVDVIATIEWDADNMYLFIDALIWAHNYSFLRYVDPITFFTPKTESFRKMENAMYDWRTSEHLWEKNPFEEDVIKWYMTKWWSFTWCDLRGTPELDFDVNDNNKIKSVRYHYHTYWWDHLEWWMYISRREHVKVTVWCLYQWWRIDYTIVDWTLIERADAVDNHAPDWIAEWDLAENLTSTVHIINQTDYDRMRERDPEDFYFVTE